MLHINRFVDRLRHLESRGVKDFTCSLQDARDLHSDITKLLSDLYSLPSRAQAKDEVITVELSGGGF